MPEKRKIIYQTPKRGIYHHSADISPTGQLQKINDWHKHLDFPISSKGWFVGYHDLISQNGFLLNTRAWNEQGAHDQGENVDSVGVAFLNNFNINKPNVAEERAMAEVMEHGLNFFDIPIKNWEPHRTNDLTDCPGRNIPDNWAQMCYLKYKISWLTKLLYWLSFGKAQI